MMPKNWTVAYHVRSADGITHDFTTDLAAARKLAGEQSAFIYEVTRSSGRSVKL
jgi:hypothetical protein